MKVAEVNRLIHKHLPANLSEYSIFRNLVFKIEKDFFLKGYDFETSGYGDSLAVWCFIQPLFVKSDSVYFTFGDRLTYQKKINWFSTRRFEWWDISKENSVATFQSIFEVIKNSGEKYLNSIKGAPGFYKKFNSEKKDDIRK